MWSQWLYQEQALPKGTLTETLWRFAEVHVLCHLRRTFRRSERRRCLCCLSGADFILRTNFIRTPRGISCLLRAAQLEAGNALQRSWRPQNRVRMCVLCKCRCVCMLLCAYVCMCVYVCMHACMHACMHVCMYVYIYVYICMYTYTYIYIYIHIYICIHK